MPPILQVARPCDTHPDQRVGLFQRLSRLVGVHPRALVADVHHLEEVGIEADAGAGLAKDRLVRPRRARSNHDAVQLVLLDEFRNLALAGRGARKELRLGDHHIGERRRIGSQLLDIQHPGHVDPAVAHHYPDPRWTREVEGLHLLHLLLDAIVAEVQSSPRRRCRCLSDAVRNDLRSNRTAADEDSFPPGLHRRNGRIESGNKTVTVSLDAEVFGEPDRTFVGRRRHRQHYQIRLEAPLVVRQGVLDENFEVVGLRDRSDLCRATA